MSSKNNTNNPYVLGIPREKCVNTIEVNAAVIRAMIQKIPFKKHTEPENKKLFETLGGADYCAAVAGFLFKLYTTRGFSIPTDSDWQAWLAGFFPDDETDSVTKSIMRIYLTNDIPHRPDGTSLEWRDLFAIAVTFGYPNYGLLSASDFAYNPAKNRFVTLDGTFAEWAQKQVDEYVQPVLIDKRQDLWLDASDYLKIYCSISGFVFDPTLPSGLVRGYAVRDGLAEFNAGNGSCIYNLYKAPTIEMGDFDPNCPEKLVQPFIEHCQRMLQTDSDVRQLISWCAHIVQKPWEKVHWAPVLYSYDQGVGKDTILNFVQGIIGSQNCATIKASEVRANFNEFAKSLMIRISELYDGSKRFSKKTFQEEVKTLISGDSETITINQKYGSKITARNLAHVVITTNNPGDLLVSNQDRRYDVFECKSKSEMGLGNPVEYKEYFSKLHFWYNHGGREALYAYLYHCDLSSFDVTMPRTTEAKVQLQFGNRDGYSWFLQITDFISERQPDIQDNAFRTDTIIAVAKFLAEHNIWDGPQENMVSKYLKAAYRAFEYDFMRGPNKDGRWTFGSKPVSIIKKNKLDKFDPRMFASAFATPSIVNNATPLWLGQNQKKEALSELEPDGKQLLLKSNQNQ